MSHLIVFFRMAKGSFLGVKRGKLGDAVGYNVANSNDKDKQGWRVYQPVVSNPQSDAQIDQRIKLAAVNNLYRALKPIIQRGWENHKYGDESRRAFLKHALGSAFVGPYLPKGSTLAVPIEGVPITYGSLTPVVVEGGSSSLVLTNVPNESSDALSFGLFSQCFINAVGAKAGDQVTIILGHLNQAGTVTYKINSFYLDPTSTDEELGTITGFDWLTVTYDDVLCLAIDISSESSFSPAYCGLVAMSRDGEGANLRSYAEFFMSTQFKSYFYGNASQIAAAKRSYRRTQSADTNWPLVPGGGGSQTVQSAFTRAGTEFTAVSIARKNVGGQNFEVIVDDGGVQYYIGSRPSAASSEIVYLSGTGSTASIDPSDLTTANSVNVFDSANTAAGLRAWLISKGIDAAVLPV